jgi:hypothetical protein
MEIGVNAEVEPVRLFSMEQVNSELLNGIDDFMWYPS